MTTIKRLLRRLDGYTLEAFNAPETTRARTPGPARGPLRNPWAPDAVGPDMTLLVGEYVPSTAKWVRDQVAEYEASGGARANTLRGSKDPIVVITSVGRKSGALRKNPLMRVERDGKYLAVASIGGGPHQPGVVPQLPRQPGRRAAGRPGAEALPGPAARRRRARGLVGVRRADLVDVRQVPAEDRAPDPDLPARRGLTRPVRRLDRTKSGRNVRDLGSAP